MSKIIISPVNGEIEAIDYIQNKIKVYINVAMLSNLKAVAPQDSTMKILKFQRGLNLDPNSYKGTLLNEQISLQFDNCQIDFISGLCNKSINFIKKDNVYRTEKLGSFWQGLVVVTLDKDIQLNISLGEKINLGDIICKI